SMSGGPVISLPTGRDGAGLPFGLQMIGPVRGDVGLLAAARSVEAFLAGDPQTARPRPDTDALHRSTVDLRSIVTHPPLTTTADGPEIKTAV
ncbi:MAG TPA: amidase, partial [Paracoccaceae bacterium]|nr:amidase [Paracoccaceae bacterium]